jgi:hypothetical protein
VLGVDVDRVNGNRFRRSSLLETKIVLIFRDDDVPALDFAVRLFFASFLTASRPFSGNSLISARASAPVAMNGIDHELGVLAPGHVLEMPVAIENAVAVPVGSTEITVCPNATKSLSPCLVARMNCERWSYIARRITSDLASSHCLAVASLLISSSPVRAWNHAVPRGEASRTASCRDRDAPARAGRSSGSRRTHPRANGCVVKSARIG